MTPDECRLWQAVYIEQSRQNSYSVYAAMAANAAVALFRQANRSDPEPNKGRL